MFQLTAPIYVVGMCSSFVGSEKTRKKETIFLAKFSIDNMSGPGKWRLWQKLAPQERCVLRRDKGSFENLESTYESFHLNQRTNKNILVFLP